MEYHLVWCPKYRIPVLVEEVAEDLDVEVKHVAIKSDHVHLFVNAPPERSPSELAKLFKGYSSRVPRQQYEHFASRMPSLWSRSYYVGASVQVSDEAIADYVAARETRGG